MKCEVFQSTKENIKTSLHGNSRLYWLGRVRLGKSDGPEEPGTFLEGFKNIQNSTEGRKIMGLNLVSLKGQQYI